MVPTFVVVPLKNQTTTAFLHDYQTNYHNLNLCVHFKLFTPRTLKNTNNILNTPIRTSNASFIVLECWWPGDNQNCGRVGGCHPTRFWVHFHNLHLGITLELFTPRCQEEGHYPSERTHRNKQRKFHCVRAGIHWAGDDRNAAKMHLTNNVWSNLSVSWMYMKNYHTMKCMTW